MPKIKFNSAAKRTPANRPTEDNAVFGTVFRRDGQCWVMPCDKERRPYLLGAVKNFHNDDLVEIEPESGCKTPKAGPVKNYGPFSMGLLNEILITRKYNIPHVFEVLLLN